MEKNLIRIRPQLMSQLEMAVEMMIYLEELWIFLTTDLMKKRKKRKKRSLMIYTIIRYLGVYE